LKRLSHAGVFESGEIILGADADLAAGRKTAGFEGKRQNKNSFGTAKAPGVFAGGSC